MALWSLPGILWVARGPAWLNDCPMGFGVSLQKLACCCFSSRCGSREPTEDNRLLAGF